MEIAGLTPRLQEVLNLRREKVSRAEIARRLGLTGPRRVEKIIQRINRILAREGEELLCDAGGMAAARYAAEVLPKTDRQAEVIALYATGLNATEVGLRIGISRQRVDQILDTCNVARHIRQESESARQVRLQAERSAKRTELRCDVLALWDAGSTRAQISQRFGVPESRVENIVKVHGKPRFRRAGPGVAITDEVARKAAKLYAEGRKIGDVASLAGVPRNSVQYALRKAEALGCVVNRRRPSRRVTTTTTSDETPEPAYIEPAYSDPASDRTIDGT